jgi:hypothetical protein
MSALKTTTGEPALRIQPIAHDRARALLGQVMGFVAVTVGFTALGAYLGRDLSGALPARARAVRRRPARLTQNFGARSTR